MSAEKYDIKVGQIWTSADGSKGGVEVVDIDTYAYCDDVVVRCLIRNIEYRIDTFKLAMCRYVHPKDQ